MIIFWETIWKIKFRIKKKYYKGLEIIKIIISKFDLATKKAALALAKQEQLWLCNTISAFFLPFFNFYNICLYGKYEKVKLNKLTNVDESLTLNQIPKSVFNPLFRNGTHMYHFVWYNFIIFWINNVFWK